jgi:hypothetical protein
MFLKKWLVFPSFSTPMIKQMKNPWHDHSAWQIAFIFETVNFFKRNQIWIYRSKKIGLNRKPLYVKPQHQIILQKKLTFSIIIFEWTLRFNPIRMFVVIYYWITVEISSDRFESIVLFHFNFDESKMKRVLIFLDWCSNYLPLFNRK